MSSTNDETTNQTNPKCGVCLDSKRVPVWTEMNSSGAYKVAYMERCPYCAPKKKEEKATTDKGLFEGQYVIYFHPDEPEGGMAGTILSIEPPDEFMEPEWGRSVRLELHNWGDKSAVESEIFPVFDAKGEPLTYEKVAQMWHEWYDATYKE